MSSYQPKNLYDLTGRVAIVTGGGTGIGLMMAHGLAASGARVYITGRRLKVLQQVVEAWDKSLGGDILPLEMDVTSKESIASAKKYIEKTEGKLHILVNNAGQSGPTTPFLNNRNAPECKDAETLGQALFDSDTYEDWAALYAVNTFSVHFVSVAFLGLLAKGSEDVNEYWSSIINISSISGVIKVAQEHFCYNSSKAAATHLTKMLATEIARQDIPVRVNSIAPGVYESEMTTATITPEYVDKIGKGLVSVPSKRPGRGEEVAGTAIYLASRAGGYTNGQEIVIDGGYVSVNPSTV